MDLLLDASGDLVVSKSGDISLTDSVAQKVRIRLKWLESEWRWNPNEGLPYLQQLFVKNPDTDTFESLVRAKIFEVPEITGVEDVSITYDKHTRKARIYFVALTDNETIREEVSLSWAMA